MKPFLLLHKPQGMTPLAAIEQCKALFPEYEHVRLGVAGRLDPMAHGLLLVLVGEENKKRKEYEALPKTYTMDVLFGVATDTYDLLGLVTHISDPSTLTEAIVQNALGKIPEEFAQPYPPYSSKPVNGKPLYYWAREGALDSIDIPKKSIRIYKRSLDHWQHIHKDSLWHACKERIERVTGDFRQEIILQKWQTLLEKTSVTEFSIATISFTCSSGTYMRGLAHTVGQTVGTGALAYSITRTHIGPHSLEESIAIV